MWPITDVVESVGWLCGRKKGPARDHERDIVHYGPYSSFVDKWIFMLINWDTDMSENCGECGIILTPRPYTWTTVVSSVCGLSLSCSKVFFFFIFGCIIQFGTMCTVNARNGHRACSQLYPSGKMLLTELPNPHLTSGIYCTVCTYCWSWVTLYLSNVNFIRTEETKLAFRWILLNHIWF